MSTDALMAALAAMPPVQPFVGQTRSARLVGRLAQAHVGEMTVCGEYPPRRWPWAYDNGCFRGAFDAATYEHELHRMSTSPRELPEFVVVPDVVRSGAGTLALAREWLPRLRAIFPRRMPPLALALQDGMTATDVRPMLRDRAVQVLFLGGSDGWRWGVAQQWVELAHAYGARCHIGRAGTPRAVAQARSVMADSLDSAFPLWSSANLDAFLAALRAPLDTAQVGLAGIG